VATLTLSFKGTTLKVYSFVDGEITIGREPECDIFIDSLALEPSHARIEITNDSATIFDLTDSIGVLVNGVATKEQALNEGDTIRVGKHTLDYSARTANIEPATQNEPPATEPAAVEETTAEPAAVAEETEAEKQTGWLQIMSGKQFGKSMPLKQGITRIGVPGKQTAAIAHRSDGYFLSPLEGDAAPTVDGIAVNDGNYELKDGCTISIAGIQLQFYLESA